MNIQDILDASDSDLSEADDLFHSITPTTKPSKKLSGEVDSDIDVERILREHDDDDEDEDDEVPITYQSKMYNFIHGNRPNDDSMSLGASTISTRPHSPKKSLHFQVLKSSTSSMPSASESVEFSKTHGKDTERWSILQKILNEEGDDDDDDYASFATKSSYKLEFESERNTDFGTFDQKQSNGSSNLDVDAILNSIESDSDDEDAADLAALNDMIAKISLGNYQSSSSDSKNALKPRHLSSDSKSSIIDFKHPVLHHEENTNGSKQNSSLQTKISHVDPESALKAAEDYERRLLRSGHREIISPLTVKRRMKQKIELQTKSRSQDSKKSKPLISPQHQQFNFSGIIESKYMQRISSQLQRNTGDDDDIGLPTALTASSKFIAIGTQRGIILVFDLFEELRQELGSGKGDDFLIDKIGSVSSITLSANGEHLIAGYANGDIILWDIIKGQMVKRVTDMHVSPISIVRFVSEKSLTIVSVDAGGLVNKITFVKAVLWNTYDAKSECLLDGSAGQILSMDVLPAISTLNTMPVRMMDDKKEPYHQSIHRLVLIALSSERSSFAIAIEPSISVLHKWPRPSAEQMDLERFLKEINEKKHLNNIIGQVPSQSSVFLPCLSWGWSLISGGENSVTPILARAWGCCVQLLRANFPPLDDQISGEEMQWPAFGIHDEFIVSAPIVSLEWLGDRSLVFLTITNELIIIDTIMMTLTERLDFTGVKLVYAELTLSRSVTSQSNSGHNLDDLVSITFQNSFLSNEGRLLVLCHQEVKSLSILAIRTQIAKLENDGEWLEALALALDHYEFTIRSQEDRKRNPDGTKDLSSHPEFLSRLRLTEDEEWIADLLLRYLCLALENAPGPDFRNIGANTKGQHIDLARSHFQMLAGVCIEFCVVTRRLDLLFNEIFQKFFDSGFTNVFLEIIEAYILNDKLKYVAPLVMSHLIEYYKALNDMATVERCLLHMDVTIMDFDSILSLLRKNEMFSAMTYVYTRGLNDFVSPLEAIFESLFRTIDSKDATISIESFHRHGYKIILYMQHCFSNIFFPSGDKILPEDRIVTLRPEILRVLLRHHYEQPRSKSENLQGIRLEPYPYILILLLLDSNAFFETISLVFDDPGVTFADNHNAQQSLEDWKNMTKCDIASDDYTLCPDRMTFVKAVYCILPRIETASTFLFHQSSYDQIFASYLDFLGKYLLRGLVKAPPPLVKQVITRMIFKKEEDSIIQLLQVLPKSSYDRDVILDVVERSMMTRASLILHKGGVSELFENGSDPIQCSQHFVSAIDCYINDRDPNFRKEVFHYIKNECIGGSTSFVQYQDKSTEHMSVHDVLRIALCKKLPQLISLDSIPCTQLVAEIYAEELDTIIRSLEENGDELIIFKFFDTILSGKLTKIDPIAGQSILANITIDQHQKYLELMCKFHPDSVYPYLITTSSYRVDECLKLCQMYDIPDASSYLLERMGNVSSALQLMLQTLEGRLMSLKRVIRNLGTTSHVRGNVLRSRRDKIPTQQLLTNLKKEKDAQKAIQMLSVALDLCERNSGQSAMVDNGTQLWFNILDRLINAKGFLRLSKEMPEHSALMIQFLSDLLRLTMQRMVPNMALPELLQKITTYHSGSSLGEFREMISSMLTTYVSEVEICSKAIDAIRHDVHQMSVKKFHLKMGGIIVKNIERKKESNLFTNNFRLDMDGTAKPLFDEKQQTMKKQLSSHQSQLNLQRRRKMNSCKRNGLGGQMKVHDGMMTLSEKLFSWGESSDAAFIPRCVGLLSEAEHFGKL